MQVQAQIGLDFASGIRTLLRQDPDIIMVGEIRDLETAEMAVQASLTGHLVISTLHTNNAPAAVIRLLNLGRSGLPDPANRDRHHGATSGADSVPAVQGCRWIPIRCSWQNTGRTVQSRAAQTDFSCRRLQGMPQYRLCRPDRHL